MKCIKLTAKTILLTLLIGFSGTLFAQPGANDPSFNPADIGFGFGAGANSYVFTSALQIDGKIIIGGDFTTYNGTARNRIARINADGTLDGTFDPGTGANVSIFTTAIQGDGKIIIGSGNLTYNGTAIKGIARINVNGTLDGTFNAGTAILGTVAKIAIQSDGKVIAVGGFTKQIVRLNPDGSVDGTFDPGTGSTLNQINTVVTQSDGKIIIGGNFPNYNGTAIWGIARLNTNGSLDGTFNAGNGLSAGGSVSTIGIQSDGKIIIGGSFISYGGTARGRIARLNTDATLDLTFDPGTGANNDPWSVPIQADGKIIIGGFFTSYNGTARGPITRLNSNGSLDLTFNPGTGANNSVYASAMQSDGKIIIGGVFTVYNGVSRSRIARINGDGSVDLTFNPGTGANADVNTIALQSDGKIIIAGSFTSYNGTSRNNIARINTDGTLDASFNPGTGSNNAVTVSAMQSDGKTIIGGYFSSYNGTTRNSLARINSDGTLDMTFDPGAGPNNSFIGTCSIQSDGKIIIGGDFTSYNGTGISKIARINTNGTLDGTFNPGTGANFDIRTTAIQTNGKIIIGGNFSSFNGTAINRIARINTDGTLDGTFNPGTGSNGSIMTTVLQSDGKVIIGGQFSSYNGTTRNNFARLNTDGSLDPIFDPGTGLNNPLPYTTAIQNDGKIVIGGDFTSYKGTGRNRIARIVGIQQNQTITFSALSTQTFNVAPFQLTATASSGLPVTYVSSDPTIASIRGNVLTVEGAGTCTITAKQSGDVTYNPAPDVPQTLTVNKGGQSITLANTGLPRLTTDGAFYPHAFATSGFPVSLSSSNTAVATVSGNQITPVGAGTTTITLSQAGDNNYLSTSTTTLLTINNPSQSPMKFTIQGGAPVSELNVPLGSIEVDGSGKIYVPNPSLHQVIILNPDGTVNKTIGSFGVNDGDLNAPSDVAVDASGNIYVVSVGNNRIEVYTPSGTFLRKFGSRGGASGRLNNPNSIVIDGSGKVFVTERSNGRVSVFNTTGTFLYSFGTSGSGNGQTSVSRGVDIDASGNVYVVDPGNSRVVVFDSNGNFLRNIGTSGSGNGQFTVPKYVKLDPSGNIYVTDDGNARVQVFDNAGNFLSSVPWPGGATGASGIAQDVSGNFYVSNYGTNELLKFSSGGTLLQTLFPIPQTNLQLFQPQGVAFDASHNVYVTSDKRVKVFSSTGSYLRTIGAPGTGDGQFNGLMGKVFVDGTGNTYVADAGNSRVQIFDNTGAFVRKVGVGTLSSPLGVTVDGAGKIYVADQVTRNIQVFQNNGTPVVTFGSSGSATGQFLTIGGVALDGLGYIYVADAGNNRIQVFTNGGTFLRTFGSVGGGNGQFRFPMDVKLDAAGNIYVADRDNHRIQVFQNDGTFLYQVGSLGYGAGAGNGHFYQPVSLDVDAAGKALVVADQLNNLVQGFGAPEINVKQTSSIATGGTFDFGNVNMLANSGAISFTIENTGGAILNLTGTPKVSVTGTNASDFVVNTTSTTTPVAAGANTTFTITFTPSASAARTAQITIANDDFDEASYVINLQGTGVKVNQTITFNTLAAKAFGDANFNLPATASSSLAVTYASSNTAVATISGNIVTVVGVGTSTITASQAGNINYNAAADVTQILTVNKANQTITFNPLTAKIFGDANFNLTAIASSTLAVTYVSSNTAVAIVSGNTVTIVGGGTTTITASQAGNGNFNAASDVPQTLTVNKASQSITFGPLTAKVFGDANFNLSATASSTLAITYASGNTAVATVSGNTVTIVGGGTTTITASQAGNVNYNAATDVPQILTVNKAAQSITFNALTTKSFGDPNFNLGATASSSLTVSYASSNTSVATISGSTVTIVGVGSSVITASQAGNSNYLAATDAPQTLNVTIGNQTITFNALSPASVGDSPITLVATSSSGLTVSYSSNNTSVATVSGNNLTIVGQGNATITASQAGNANYNAATSVDQVISVKQGQTITFGALAAKNFGDAAFNLSATASSSLAVTYSSSNTSVATVSGNTVTLVGAGSSVITASQSGNGTFNAASNVAQTLTVNKAAQTITFAALTTKTLGDAPFNISGTSSSSFAVQFTATPAGRVTIAGNQVTITGAGSVTIQANQAGNANFLAATAVSQTFCINPVKPAITLSGSNTEAPLLTSSSSSGNIWFLNGTAIPNATNPTLTISGAGAYTVQIKVDNCTSTMSDQQAIIVTGDLANTTATAKEFTLYPNPATTHVDIRGLKGEVGVAQFIDLTGRSIQVNLEKRDEVYRASVLGLSDGIYLLRIQDANSVHQVKFVKK